MSWPIEDHVPDVMHAALVTGLIILAAAGLDGLVVGTVVDLLKAPLGASGLLALGVIWGGAGLLGAVVVIGLGLFLVEGILPANLLIGLVGGAGTAGYVSWRLGRPVSVGLLAGSGAAWAAAFALSVLVTNVWYGWSNEVFAGGVAALGSFPLFLSLRKSA